MQINRNYIVITYLLTFLVGCSSLEKSQQERIRHKNTVAESIIRLSDQHIECEKMQFKPQSTYPWEHHLGERLITKEYFRCQGSARNCPKQTGDQTLFDCSGSHSLPLKDGKEFIWPTMIDLLNEIQEKTGKRVVITCGHRCPAHNTYADPARYNQNSKHQIGAEVDFYVEGLEYEPEKIIELILNHYPPNTFKRYEKGGLNVSTKPWFNREIFIKLYKEDEGRDLDNTHPFPYISIQMRYDTQSKEWITYTWDAAFKNYLRETL